MFVYPSVQNLFPSSLLPKNISVQIYRTIILPVAVYVCESGLSPSEKSKGWECPRTGC